MSFNDGASIPPGGQPQTGAAPVFQLATWVQRFVAFLIDWALYTAIIVIGAIIGGDSSAIVSLFWLIAVGFWIWQLWNQGEKGYTIGKKALGIRVIWEANGQLLGGGMSIARGFTHVVDVVPCYVGFLWPLWDAKRQTFADKILKTVVVTA